MNLKKICLAILLSGGLAGCSLVKYTIDHAPYTVQESSGDIEVRYYDRLVLASTPMGIGMPGEVESSNDGAFRRLFAYISGDNSQALDISMTAPVFMDERKNQKMSFVLPAGFTGQKAPQPDSRDVYIETLSGLTVASIRFSGVLDQETIEKYSVKLRDWVLKKGAQVSGPVMLAAYDPPSSIPWFRRNEVLMPIEFNRLTR